MNTIEYEGKRLRIVRFRAPLYRADRQTFLPGSLASNDYRGASMKYFTLAKNETDAYSKYGMPHIKTWEPIEELILVDILHTPTRHALEQIIGSNSISVAFPMKGNRVSRVSEENTKHHNDTVLRSICDLGIVDGYYMRRLNKNNMNKFHSEVGLCQRALRKLRLLRVNRNQYQAPPPPTRKRRGNNNNNSGRKTRSRLFMNND